MFHDNKDWEKYALFENDKRASRRIMQNTLSGRHEPVMEPGMLARWKDISIWKIPVSASRKVYVRLMANIMRFEFSRILLFMPPSIMNYAKGYYRMVTHVSRSG